MNKQVKVYNDGELVYEGILESFLEINSDDLDFILKQIDFDKEINRFYEISGEWEIVFIK